MGREYECYCNDGYELMSDGYSCTGTLQEYFAELGFSFRGGGGAKDYVAARTLRARNRTHFWQESRARFKGPGSSRVVLMLSRAI